MASRTDTPPQPETDDTAERIGVWRRLRVAPWQTKAGLAAAVVIGLPLLFAVLVYALPPKAAVAIGEPVLAILSDSPPLPGDLDPVTERSVLLAADGSELATLFDDVNRVRIQLDDVADVAVDALLAAEDEAFYAHPGINHRAVMRAAFSNLRSGGVEQGGSTLTQQLVKNVYLKPRQTFRRKLTEAWYALQLEKRLTKDEILERYLNEASFGEGTYGIAAASELYFGVPPAELDAGQAAMLVGILPAPSARNPIEDPQAARDARDAVLARMAATGVLPERAARQAREAELALDITPPPPPAEPFFVAYVRNRLLEDPRFDEVLGSDEQRRERTVYGGGLTIHTSLDTRLQDLAQDAITAAMGDPATSPQAAIVSVTPGTGHIRAMAVGPKTFGSCGGGSGRCPRTMVNPIAPGLGGSGRQPGSAFKPFVALTALQEGVPRGWQQRTAGGEAIEGCDDDGEPYEPENYRRDPGVKDMAEALQVSNNVYHAKLAGMLGPENLVAVARAAGVASNDLPEQCSVALGSGSVYPIDMASAYATFAAEGTYCEPYTITKIEVGALADARDAAFEPRCEDRLQPIEAAQISLLLRNVVANGTGTAAQLDRPVAGKTGTTDDYRDAWFVGYVPQLATAAWVGYEQPAPMTDVLGVARVTGGSVPAAMWSAYMRPAVEPLDVERFPDVPGRERIDVPDFSGQVGEDVKDDYADDYTFNVELNEVRDYREAGTIVKQAPPPGRTVDTGRLLVLSVSDGKGKPPRVPDVVGEQEEDARAILTDARYEVSVETEQRALAEGEAPPTEEGTVVRMRPEAGTPLEPGEQVTIVVVEYERYEVPDGEGDDEGEGDGEDNGDGDGDGDGQGRPGDDPGTGSAAPVDVADVRAAPRGDDLERDGGEYVVLESRGRPVDVSGWTIEHDAGGVLRIGSGYHLTAGTTLRVHTGPGRNRPPRAFFNGLDEEVLLDDGGVLVVRDRQGREVTRVEYGP